MKKKVLFIAVSIVMLIGVQCTEDDSVEASVQKENPVSIESGEEGDQDLDNKRD